jgi:hypothetical protein
MIRARQIGALAGVSVLGFGASFALGHSGDHGHRAGPEAAGRPGALSVPRTLAAGTLPLPDAVPDLAIPQPAPPAAPAAGPAATTAPESATAPEPATDPPTPAPEPPRPTTHPKPAPPEPTVTTIIGG